MGNRPGGNNPKGRNQYSAPPADSLLRIGVEVRGLEALLRSYIGSAKRIDTPVLEAHRYMARELQEAQQGVLNDAIFSGEFNTSRRARPQYRAGALPLAIVSDANRSVNVNGFHVGRLDNIASVKSYWRGLEYGTKSHIGRFLPGYFVDEGGTPVPFDAGRTDPFQVRGHAPLASALADPATFGKRGQKRTPFRARIRNETKAIHFQKRGYEEWRASEGSSVELIMTYRYFMEKAGVFFPFAPGAVKTNLQGLNRDPVSAHPPTGRFGSVSRNR